MNVFTQLNESFVNDQIQRFEKFNALKIKNFQKQLK